MSVNKSFSGAEVRVMVQTAVSEAFRLSDGQPNRQLGNKEIQPEYYAEARAAIMSPGINGGRALVDLCNNHQVSLYSFLTSLNANLVLGPVVSEHKQSQQIELRSERSPEAMAEIIRSLTVSASGLPKPQQQEKKQFAIT